MGRPDLTEQRTAEILDAFERCVARFGLEGSSLERIAEEAGMRRSILRHYIGNRDEMVVALADRVVAKYQAHMRELMQSISDSQQVERLVNLLLPSKPRESADSVLVIESLIAAADQYPQVRQQMQAYVDDIVESIATHLRHVFPGATKVARWGVAYGVVSIWFNQESLSSLQLQSKYLAAAKKSMTTLINSLGAKQD